MPRLTALALVAALAALVPEASAQRSSAGSVATARVKANRSTSRSSAPPVRSTVGQSLGSRLRSLIGLGPKSGPPPTREAREPRKPSWARIDASKTQQSVALIPHPSAPGRVMTLKPSHHGGGYHGTTLTEAQLGKLFSKGLPGQGSSIDLLAHAEKSLGEASGFRGTTAQISDPIAGSGAAYWAGRGGYVIEIRKVPTWDVNALLQGRVKRGLRFGGNLMEGETELAVPRLIHPWQIKRVGRVVEDSMGRLKVERWIDNPHYQD